MLLDTQSLLWFLEDSDRLGSCARAAVIGASAPQVSTASLWEIAVKRHLGKLRTPEDLPELIVRSGFRWLPVNAAHAWSIQDVALPHRDPFDRMLVAQALVEGLTLVTADRVLLAAAPEGVTILDARA